MNKQIRNNLTVSAEALFEIEHVLSDPLFFGIPIGSTLGDFYSIELRLGKGRWYLRSIIRDRLSYVKNRLWGTCQRTTRLYYSSELSSNSGRILFTWIHEDAKISNLTLPVINAFPEDQCYVIGKTAVMKSRLPKGVGFLTYEELPGINMNMWRKEYKKCAPVWRERLKKVLRKHNIPLFIMPRFQTYLLIQSRRIMACSKLLDQLKPAAVVTEFDRNSDISSHLVLAARVRGIPTMAMMHGVITPSYGYTPLLADVVFCWGKRHLEQFIEMGEKPEKLIVTGCQRLNRKNLADKNLIKRKLGLVVHKPLVLLATTTLNDIYRKQIAKAFCEGFHKRDGVSAIVRLHPAEKLETYAEEIAAYPDIRFFSNKDCSLDEALTIADIVVSRGSGFADDALVKGKLAVILDVIRWELANDKDLIERARCLVARSSSELYDIIMDILNSPGKQKQLREHAEHYIKYFCAAFGNEAVENVKREITKRISVCTKI